MVKHYQNKDSLKSQKVKHKEGQYSQKARGENEISVANCARIQQKIYEVGNDEEKVAEAFRQTLTNLSQGKNVAYNCCLLGVMTLYYGDTFKGIVNDTSMKARREEISDFAEKGKKMAQKANFSFKPPSKRSEPNEPNVEKRKPKK